MTDLDREVKSDIREFLELNMAAFRDDAKEYGGMDITIACNDDGTQWNYQTGDNSYTGGAYGLQHWAVDTIDDEMTWDDVYQSIINQLEDLIA
jgi:hypothetical protein